MTTVRQHRNQRRLNRLKRRRKKMIIRFSILLVILILIISLLVWLFNLIFGSDAAQSVASGNVTGVASSSVVDIYNNADAVLNVTRLKEIEDSDEYPTELKELATTNPETIEYVYYYPEDKDEDFPIDLTEEVDSEEVPYLMQWDKRWGYLPYGNGLVGYTGCGPTCLSMVALHFLDDPELSPKFLAEFSIENGYSVADDGSSWELFSRGASTIGLSSKEVPLSENEMKEELDSGNLLVIVVGPGDFTTSGHYMVISGYDDDGFKILDPNSRAISEQAWAYDTLESQINNIWSLGL